VNLNAIEYNYQFNSINYQGSPDSSIYQFFAEYRVIPLRHGFLSWSRIFDIPIEDIEKSDKINEGLHVNGSK
jgi:hypothetical protein